MDKQFIINKYLGRMIKIIDMKGEPHYNGRLGMVRNVDDIGQLHGTWGGLAVDLSVDKVEVLK